MPDDVNASGEGPGHLRRGLLGENYGAVGVLGGRGYLGFAVRGLGMGMERRNFGMSSLTSAAFEGVFIARNAVFFLQATRGRHRS